MNPIKIRASSFGSLFDCPSRWIATHLEGRRMPSNGKAALGTALHKGTAVFDSEVLFSGRGSLSSATDAAVALVQSPICETIWEDGNAEQSKAEKIARSLTEKYCLEESPRHTFVAVEASVETLFISDLNIILTGTTDRIMKDDKAGYGVGDIKSGKQAVGSNGTVSTKGHAAQMGVYELVASAAVGIEITAPATIVGLQTNLTPDKQRIGTGKITGARQVLLGDDTHQGLLHTAAKIVHGEYPPWGNPRSMMCHNNYCPVYAGCFWRR